MWHDNVIEGRWDEWKKSMLGGSSGGVDLWGFSHGAKEGDVLSPFRLRAEVAAAFLL